MILEVDSAIVVNVEGASGSSVVVTEYSEESALEPTELMALTLNLYVSCEPLKSFFVYDVDPVVLDAKGVKLLIWLP